MWRRLTLAGAQRRFQFPTQTLRFLLQTLDLFAHLFVLLLRPVQLPFRNKPYRADGMPIVSSALLPSYT